MGSTTRWTVDAIDHALFARLSGDYNPIHMNLLAARRTQAGAPIVHGIHSVLTVLDRIGAAETRIPGDVRIRARFLSPIYVGDDVTVEITRGEPNVMRARILHEGIAAVAITVSFCTQRQTAPAQLDGAQATQVSVPNVPYDLSFAQMEGLKGHLALASDAVEAEAAFPFAVRLFGAQQIAALMCCSCLVGMIVPGLHSLFAGLELSLFEDATVIAGGLQFAVTSVRPRHRVVRLAIRGQGLLGSLESLGRAPPVVQPSMGHVRSRVSKDDFSGATALIVGGSRGLGELTAKIVAAGGGRVVLTYARGQGDAEAVVAEIGRTGAECTAVAYDVLRGAAEQPAAFEAAPTHVYYFATPLISRKKLGVFDPRRLAEFNSYYLTGFFDLIQTCLRRTVEAVTIFYPSSVFVEARPEEMTEYAMSKAAGEILCSDMQKTLPNLRILVRRLPRLLTDQTSAEIGLELSDPIDALLPIVREMHSLAASDVLNSCASTERRERR